MSSITTVVVIGGGYGEISDRLAKGYFDGERQVSFGDLRDDPNGTRWGGTKSPTMHTVGGAFNYLDLDQFERWLRSLPWDEEEGAVVVLQHEYSEGRLTIWTFGAVDAAKGS